MINGHNFDSVNCDYFVHIQAIWEISMFRELEPRDCIKPKRQVDRLFIHCSATDKDDRRFKGTSLAKLIDSWHKQRGWTGIGYHFVIDKDGTLVTGRDIEKTPAAQGGHNTGTIAVCLNGLEVDKFTKAQLDTLVHFCRRYHGLYGDSLTFHGHCEVSAKSCPVIDYKRILKLDKHGRLGV